MGKRSLLPCQMCWAWWRVLVQARAVSVSLPSLCLDDQLHSLSQHLPSDLAWEASIDKRSLAVPVYARPTASSACGSSWLLVQLRSL